MTPPKNQESRIRIVVAALIKKGPRYLLLQEGRTKGNLWSPPQGKVDRGETILQAIQREVKEETSLTFRPTRLLAPLTFRTHSRRGLVSLRLFFLGTWSGTPQAHNEIQSFRWFTPAQIRSLPLRTPELLTIFSRRTRLLPLSTIQTLYTDKPN